MLAIKGHHWQMVLQIIPDNLYILLLAFSLSLWDRTWKYVLQRGQPLVGCSNIQPDPVCAKRVLYLQDFDAYLQDAVANPNHSVEQRHQLLADWEKGPSARTCHPREEHLLPLMVAAGAAKYSPAEIVYSDKLMGARISGYMWS